MKLNSKLLFIAALIALVIPFVLTGYASAASYNPDGAYHDNTNTGWKLPVADGSYSCPADTTATNRRDCEAVRFPAYTDSASCSASPEFTSGTAQWTSACDTSAGSNVGISLKDHDRNALACDSLGGVYESVCAGKWTAPQPVDTSNGTGTGPECLRCHSNTIQYNSYVERWKSSYVKTGHKNMLRRVTAGEPWADPAGVVYAADGSGNHIDWTNATVTRTDLTPNDRTLYYIYGDWMAPGVSTVYDNSAAGDGSSAKYTCASCHTTGYEATNFVTTKQPYLTYPGITSQITGSWDRDGIVCSRCHNSGTITDDAYREGLGWGSYLSFSSHEVTPSGAQRTSLCIECHNSTQTKADPAGELKTAATGEGFSGHIIGNEFLNSPHAQFTGTSGQVSTAANYASDFKDGDACSIIKTGVTSSSGQRIYGIKSEDDCEALVTDYAADSYTWTVGTDQGSCVTCHDVHQSIVPEVGADEPLKKECTTCHDGSVMPQKDLNRMMHPTTAGTPAGLAGSDEAEACVICHMSLYSTEGSTHLPPHLWRINTSESYRTFPTSTEWSAGTKIANTSPDDTYTDAVWIDLDLACGQCHGGSAGPSATLNGAPFMNKAYLAAVAGNMHQDPPPPLPKYSITVDISPAIGKNTHFVLQKCTSNGCSTKEVGKAVDTYTFKARKAGNYKVKVYKKNYTYDCESTGRPKVKITTTDADVTVTCTHTP